MPIPVTTAADLARHFDSLGVGGCRKVAVHSRLISFGRIEGGPSAVYGALRASLGEEATIAVPTYTFHLDETTPYDPARTPSTNAGVFSEHVRCLPGSIRSMCPIHSHAAIGPAAAVLGSVSGEASMGPGSDFEALQEAGFFLLLLGCEFEEGATFVHHMEAEVGVPYRSWCRLKRQCVVGGRIVPRTVKYYARASHEWVEDFAKVRTRLERTGRLRMAECPLGRSYLIGLDDLAAEVDSMLRGDPFAVVRRSVQVGA